MTLGTAINTLRRHNQILLCAGCEMSCLGALRPAKTAWISSWSVLTQTALSEGQGRSWRSWGRKSEPAGASCPHGRTEAVTAAAEMLWQRRCWPGVFSGRKRGWFCEAGPEMGSQSVPYRRGMWDSKPWGSFLIQNLCSVLKHLPLETAAATSPAPLCDSDSICEDMSWENIWARWSVQPHSPSEHSQRAWATFLAVTHQSKLEISLGIPRKSRSKVRQDRNGCWEENTKHNTGEILIAKPNSTTSQPGHPTPSLDMDVIRVSGGARVGITPLMPNKANLE